MNNRRAILFFLIGIVLLGGLLAWLEVRARRPAPNAREGVLCAFAPELVDACFIQCADRNEVELARAPDGQWHLVRPFAVDFYNVEFFLVGVKERAYRYGDK